MDISKLKAVIQQANPSIMELKFGCEVGIADVALFPARHNDGAKSKAVVLYYSTGGYNGQDYDGDTLMIYSDDWGQAFCFGEGGEDGDGEIPTYEILGRPIRLADVLIAGNGKIHDIEIPLDEHYAYTYKLLDTHEHQLTPFWNLLDDNLDNQSDECKKFLTDLLVGSN